MTNNNNNNNTENNMTIKVISTDGKNYVAWTGSSSDFQRDFPDGIDTVNRKNWKIVYTV
tara:strand:+ start:355 stop:531 length:177 start_codon:yes stop_codon:yes gene_type:complete